MPRPRLSSEERKQRRREAALKGIAARAARQETAPAPVPAEPDVLTAARLIARAQAIGRESDLYYRAHLARYGSRASQWSVEQRQALDRFLDGFIRPDGTVQPVPHRRRKSR
jgi:hypothetical protein